MVKGEIVGSALLNSSEFMWSSEDSNILAFVEYQPTPKERLRLKFRHIDTGEETYPDFCPAWFTVSHAYFYHWKWPEPCDVERKDTPPSSPRPTATKSP
jgi:hypothetical protein